MVEPMKKCFDELVYKKLARKGKNNQLFTSDQYMSLIQKVKEAKQKTSKKTPEDYQRLARYDVLPMGEEEKLIVPVKKEGDPVIYYVHLDETFQIIHDFHVGVGHGGRNRMMKELKSIYKNITAEVVTIYLSLCEVCQKRRNLPKREQAGMVNSSNELNSRCQVDLLSMESQPDEDYKFIMIYQDHITKFVQLRPLKTNQVNEVANCLLDIFTILGAPNILQSDNGRDFATEVVNTVCSMWPELKLVHGRPRHSSSQESIGTATHNVKQMLYTWVASKKETKWSDGLRFIQFTINRTALVEMDRSPYEAMFGCKAKVGLATSLPQDSLGGILTEEELETLLIQNENRDAQETENRTEADIEIKEEFPMEEEGEQ